MSRSSITFTTPNENWIKTQIDSQEFSSKSEVINDLIRSARAKENQYDYVRAMLIEGERSGLSERTPEQIMESVINRKS
ncbi:MAG: CopG family transcriptional regulator [Kangiella sp.]|nr:MAG: CopG family transcriptional regulator [Kangiella sp.]